MNEELEQILAKIISDYEKIKKRVTELERNANTNTTVDLINSFGEVTNPYQNQLVYNKSDKGFYYYDDSSGWVSTQL